MINDASLTSIITITGDSVNFTNQINDDPPCPRPGRERPRWPFSAGASG